MNPGESTNFQTDDSFTTRRHFLQQAAGLAAGAAVFSGISTQGEETPVDGTKLLPTVKLGEHAVSRLIIGGNPIYGYSHFNRILSQYQTQWHTPERVIELLHHA